MLRQIKSVFSFLTIVPVGSSDLQTIAKYMYLFPIIGIAIGLAIGSLAYGLSLFLEPLVVGLLITGALALITGIHHTDGLSDFADGLMLRGTKEKKLQVMRDPSVGSAGIFAIILYVGGTVIALSSLKGFELFEAILIGEIIAKFSMVLLASLGPSAWEGSNSLFIQSMRDRKKLAIAAVMTAVPIVLLGNNTGFLALAVGIILTMIILGISRRSFGGVSGDIMGATNEITRLASLLVFVSA